MEVVDISGMVSEYIRRSHYNESVSVLSSNFTPGLKEVFRQQHRQQPASEVGTFFNQLLTYYMLNLMNSSKFVKIALSYPFLDNRRGVGGSRD